MKNILITGTTNGIGKALKRHFLKEGCRVIGLDKEMDTEEDERFELIHIDLADNEALQTIVDTIGDRKIYAIINNAAEFRDNSFSGFSLEKFERSHLVNSAMPLAICASLSSQLQDSVSKVVNVVSSDAYFAGYDDLGYASSKAALINNTKSMSAALGQRGIRVNAVAPGWVDTNMAENAQIDDLSHQKTPLGRNAKPDEIVDLIDYLISDRSSFISGSIIDIDGGYSMVDSVVQQEYLRGKEES